MEAVAGGIRRAEIRMACLTSYIRRGSYGPGATGNTEFRRMWNRNGTMMAFLAMTFAILGLLGLFATVVTPIPLERALARDAALDEAAAAARGPNPQAAIEALRPRLGE